MRVCVYEFVLPGVLYATQVCTVGVVVVYAGIRVEYRDVNVCPIGI
jgi:hypothetical protein